MPGLCGASHAATVAQLWHCPQLTERIHCGTSAACCCWRRRCWGASTSSSSSTSRATAAGEILRSNANLQQACAIAPAPATALAPANANAAHSGASGFAEQRLAKLKLVEYGRYHAYTHRRGQHGWRRRRGGGWLRQTASLQFGYER